MTKYGYAYAATDKEYLDLQVEGLEKFGIDELVLEDADSETAKAHQELENLIAKLEQGDQLVVYHLVDLGKSTIQLADLINDLDGKGVQIVVVEKANELKMLNDSELALVIKRFASMEKIIIRERTARGLEAARKNGRIGGRPKISQETVERIEFLYNNNKYTLRQIAEECNISLGTAYKYTQSIK